eukprot:TRINITY_DN4912_c0_g1::TRINITY_DN4912_c0_g1_i1::g.16633::m.16633 TRINITY_DN4912_c0_g1::TRINITY_DN4912_c0_g1_i1::g.16633  ORF type:complete len:261 (-),score=103.44,DUF1084/PF06454.6/2.2e-09,Yip1/PF04893.12/0.0097,7TM_GPCR_Srh/PF10318.4/4.6,7TM_GPCR_Srh/PF10318.4/1.1,Cyto_ox_2/PF02322.10/0.056,HAMP/PF00672.20/3.1,HAMP/PF00672.20/1.6e+02,Colicin_V/PF02674.11/0.2,Lung_7-TM_R/PF06814.8/0.28,DUF2975/PF11188.3/0.42,DUF4064/PF13273.1/3.7,DUF4064/PF13273.1/21,MARVEL/PF01284.18/2.8,MARVEL/PF01284.18/1.2e+
MSDDAKKKLNQVYMVFISLLALALSFLVMFQGARLFSQLHQSMLKFSRNHVRDRLIKTTVLMVTTAISFALHAVMLLIDSTTDVIKNVNIAGYFIYLLVVEMVPSLALLFVMRHNVIPPNRRNTDQAREMLVREVRKSTIAGDNIELPFHTDQTMSDQDSSDSATTPTNGGSKRLTSPSSSSSASKITPGSSIHMIENPFSRASSSDSVSSRPASSSEDMPPPSRAGSTSSPSSQSTMFDTS